MQLSFYLKSTCINLFPLCFSFLLEELASAECQQDVIPFLCLYGFPLCSSMDQQLILPTEEECERIRSTTCQVEYDLAILLGFGNLLPDCNLLPSSNGNEKQ